MFEIGCVRCSGDDDDCELCSGSGKEPVYRCPVKLVTPDISYFFKFYAMYKQGYLPVAGGVLDQASLFMQAAAIVDKEVAEQTKEK